jgi:hypothetical protein
MGPSTFPVFSSPLVPTFCSGGEIDTGRRSVGMGSLPSVYGRMGKGTGSRLADSDGGAPLDF